MGGGGGATTSHSSVTLGANVLLHDSKPTAQTLKPTLTFQLYVSDRSIADRRTEVASSGGKRKELVFFPPGYQESYKSILMLPCSLARPCCSKHPPLFLSLCTFLQPTNKNNAGPCNVEIPPSGQRLLFYWMLQRKESLSFSFGRRRGHKSPSIISMGANMDDINPVQNA